MNAAYKKLIAFLLAVALLASLTGCGAGASTASVREEAADHSASTDTAANLAEESESVLTPASNAEAAEDGSEPDDYTWQDLQELNAEEDLLYMFDEEDYLTFLGNPYCTDIVTNEDEALASLSHLSTLTGIGELTLTHYRTDVSPVTGNVYYTFAQTGTGEINGETVVARFYNTMVKVITDAEGNVLGVSSDLKHDTDLNFTTDKFVTEDVAEYWVDYQIGKDYHVYDELTELIYWDDEDTAVGYAGGKIVPAYLVYADANPNDEANISQRRYQVFIIAAEYTQDADDSVSCLQTFYTDALESEALNDVYTSEIFFDPMEDVGEYTYTLSTEWITAAYPAYAGEASRQVTVPVMQDTQTGLYYLGSKEKRVTCSNYYDFALYNTLNAYVTEHPEDPDSWHFVSSGLPEDGIEAYFNDPNYVLAAFEVFVNVSDDFNEQFSLPSVDSSDMPLLLMVYATAGVDYPTESTGFLYNAFNAGQFQDWGIMGVSPTLPECLSYTVISHEFTHGINSQLTSTQYLNASGALMESYADIIGVQLAMLQGRLTAEEAWNVGGTYAEQFRSMSDPLLFQQPKYIGGTYYVSPVDTAVAGEEDFGGVHINSGICNYLAYCLVNGNEVTESQSVLTLEENLDMWFETLYMATYITDYYDQAQFLLFAARSMGLSEEKQEYLWQLILAFGLDAEYDENGDLGEMQVAFEEDHKELTFSVEFTDPAYADDYVIGIKLLCDNEQTFRCGDVRDGETLSFYVSEDEYIITPELLLGDVECGITVADFYPTDTMEDHFNYILDVIDMTTDEQCTLACSEYETYSPSFDTTEDELITLYETLEGDQVFAADIAGTYLIAYSNEGDTDVYIVVLRVSDAEES